MAEDKKTLASYFTKKVIVGLSVVASLFAIVGGIWGFETHYATNKRVDGVEVAHAEDISELEIQLAGALENTQHKMDVKYWQFMVNKFSEDALEIKRQMRRYPEDEILKEDYRETLRRKSEAQKKLDESMEKIKVN